jgi:hypothetical protein
MRNTVISNCIFQRGDDMILTNNLFPVAWSPFKIQNLSHRFIPTNDVLNYNKTQLFLSVSDGMKGVNQAKKYCSDLPLNPIQTGINLAQFRDS